MKMFVYYGIALNRITHQRVPMVIETNVRWALPYWTARRAKDANINWRIA